MALRALIISSISFTKCLHKLFNSANSPSNKPCWNGYKPWGTPRSTDSPDLTLGEPHAERGSCEDVILAERLREALGRINPALPAEALEDPFRKATRPQSPGLVESNRRFHQMLVDGVDVEYEADWRILHDKAWLIDYQDLANNDWLALNQFTVVEHKRTRRPDVVIFINGLPLVLIELKNPADEEATTQERDATRNG